MSLYQSNLLICTEIFINGPESHVLEETAPRFQCVWIYVYVRIYCLCNLFERHSRFTVYKLHTQNPTDAHILSRLECSTTDFAAVLIRSGVLAAFPLLQMEDFLDRDDEASGYTTISALWIMFSSIWMPAWAVSVHHPRPQCHAYRDRLRVRSQRFSPFKLAASRIDVGNRWPCGHRTGDIRRPVTYLTRFYLCLTRLVGIGHRKKTKKEQRKLGFVNFCWGMLLGMLPWNKQTFLLCKQKDPLWCWFVCCIVACFMHPARSSCQRQSDRTQRPVCSCLDQGNLEQLGLSWRSDWMARGESGDSYYKSIRRRAPCLCSALAVTGFTAAARKWVLLGRHWNALSWCRCRLVEGPTACSLVQHAQNCGREKHARCPWGGWTFERHGLK